MRLSWLYQEPEKINSWYIRAAIVILLTSCAFVCSNSSSNFFCWSSNNCFCFASSCCLISCSCVKFFCISGTIGVEDTAEQDTGREQTVELGAAGSSGYRENGNKIHDSYLWRRKITGHYFLISFIYTNESECVLGISYNIKKGSDHSLP